MRSIFHSVKFKIGDFALLASLIILPVTNFDVILGMDWLSSYHAIIDCFNKTIQLKVEENIIEFVGEKKKIITRRISALKVGRLLKSECECYLAFGLEEKPMKKIVDQIDVFLEEISGLPPSREIEFTIELAPGIAPISRAPYRKAPAELRELKVQIQDLLDKGFVRPSVSP